MRREGRQHGLVRTRPVLPPDSGHRPRVVNQLDGPPVVGIFAKVSSKPTNHSKFTGKCDRQACGECHGRPSSKSKEKTKGSRKFRSIKSLSLDQLGLDNYKEGGASEIVGNLMGGM